jgi:hypothetical protein
MGSKELSQVNDDNSEVHLKDTDLVPKNSRAASGAGWWVSKGLNVQETLPDKIDPPITRHAPAMMG